LRSAHAPRLGDFWGGVFPPQGLAELRRRGREGAAPPSPTCSGRHLALLAQLTVSPGSCAGRRLGLDGTADQSDGVTPKAGNQGPGAERGDD
jgi:hypothetical protein